MKNKTFLSKVLSMVLVFSMLISTSSIFAQNQTAAEETFTPKFNLATLTANDYALLTTEVDSAVEVNSAIANINANVYSSGDFIYTGSQLALNGECNVAGKIKKTATAQITKSNEKVVRLSVKDYTDEMMELIAFDCDTYEQNQHLQSGTVSIDKDTVVKGSLKITASILNASSYIIAENDIEINTSLIRTNKDKPLILVSKNGNVNINSSIDDFNGIIYAPNGTVNVNTTNFNLNGKINAKKIIFNSSSVTIKDNKEYADKYLTIMPTLSLESDSTSMKFALENVKQFDYRLQVQRYEFPLKELCAVDGNTTLEVAKEEFYGLYRYMITLTTESGKMLRSNVINYFTTLSGDGADYDGDGLDDETEVKYLNTDPYNPDTDGDGLLDGYEVFMTFTDPLKVDTDGNDVNDGDEDYDEEGLTSLQEYEYGTYPMNEDTDGDQLTDYEEIFVYFTDPLKPDTDGDGLNDADDIKLGFDPLNPDTDGNGILDGDEKVEQTLGIEIVQEENPQITGVEVNFSTNGNIENSTSIKNTYGVDLLSTDVVGLIGVPVDITTTADFDEATIKFHYDESLLGETKEEDLSVMWYDEENNFYQILDEDSVIDTENNTISYVTNHFSTYLVVDSKQWYQLWMNQRKYIRDPVGPNDPTAYFDIGYVIDRSSSMGGTKIFTAKEATKAFVDATYAKDSSCVVGFNSYASVYSDFTTDKVALKTAVNSIYASGGTSVNAGLSKAIDLFESKADPNPSKMIILLCDGSVNATEATIQRAVNNNIKVYPVLIGSSNASPALQNIADKTGGTFYYAATAEEIRDALFGIKDDTIGDIDTTDTDGDGLYDIYETAGMIIPNGQYIYTNPLVQDTDKDGLSDAKEMGKLEDADLSVVKRFPLYFAGKKIYAQYFNYKSDPTKEDSDGDGLLDGKAKWVKGKKVAPKDPNPLKANGPVGIWQAQYEQELKGNIPSEIGEWADIDWNLPSVLTGLGSYALHFKLDEKKMAIHSQVNTWQWLGGYNDFYDLVFRTATNHNMRREKFEYNSNSEDYIVWTWRGNYLNLGSGAEIGIYQKPITVPDTDFKHWLSADFTLPMTLNLYNYYSEDNIENIFCWAPNEKQWWITGFNPDFRKPDVTKMVSLGTIDFSEKPGMFGKLKESVTIDDEIKDFMIFDEDGHTVWLIWWEVEKA